MPPRSEIAAKSFSAAPGTAVDLHDPGRWLEANGFSRASTVRDTGEYAVRGGIVDLYPPSMPAPVRLDFFGDMLESIRTFDPESQRTTGAIARARPRADERSADHHRDDKRFRQGYVGAFGAQTRGDALYEAVSEGRRPGGSNIGCRCSTASWTRLFDYVGDAPLLLDPSGRDAATRALRADRGLLRRAPRRPARKTRRIANYKPLPPDELYLTPQELRRRRLDKAATAHFSPFAAPDGGKRR